MRAFVCAPAVFGAILRFTLPQPIRMRKLITVVVAMIAIMACGSATGPDLTTYAGNYALRSVNDTLLPYVVDKQANYLLEITTDTIYVAVKGTFVDVTHYRRTNAAVIDFPADSLRGAWAISGSTMTFRAVSGEVFNATLSGSTITVVGSGARAVYSK